MSGARSAASSRAPAVSIWVEGTQEDSWTRMSITVRALASQEIADAGQADDIGDLVRVADRGGDAARADAAVEFERA